MRVEDELKTYLQVLWRYKWLIAACTMIAALVALGISLILTPIYSATATIRVATNAGGSSDYVYLSTLTRLTNTLVEIATSPATLYEVADQLNMEELPDVEVDIVPETELVRISASDPDPARARDIANTVAGMMVEQSRQFYEGSTPTAREILEGQLEQAKTDLDSAITAYDSALRCTDSQASSPGISSNCPNAETLAHILGVRQEIYTDILQKYETARTTEELRASAVSIAEYAIAAERPSAPRVPLNVALGLMAGLATGVVLAFLFEGLDGTLRGIEDVQAMTSLPIMSLIPEKKRKIPSSPRALFSPPAGLMQSPAFHQLAARLILSGVTPKSTSYLLTSPEPGAGKSTIAANLSVSLVEAGHRVVLVDMDLHRPRLHSILNLSNERGLGDYVCGNAQLMEIQQGGQNPNLRVITAGSSRDLVMEWLSPVNLRILIDQLSQDADFVLLDGPAFLSVADPALIASQVDAVILVVARRKTGREQFRLTLQQLTELNARIAGVVVNRAPNSRLYDYYSKKTPAQKKAAKSEEVHHLV